ncbi:MAG: pitrilysin family protein [Pseudomonadota bacterium]
MTRSGFLTIASAGAIALCTASGAVAGERPASTPAADAVPLLPVTTFTLPNGLRVIFHIDRSDPVASVALAAHVGSARETAGRTGFAHMFEHLFFLNSENLGRGGLDKLSARVGGSGANGNTSTDVTIYLQEVPNDALEKMIWAEADKLGYFIKTVTDPVLAKEKEVVKNEKRQTTDNRPYGHAAEIILAALYPADHPYSWEVIGSMADLNAATLKDVQGFYHRWYVPNNATLVIAGDFEPAHARNWIEKYFGEIPRGADVPRAAPRPAMLKATKSLMYEDSFAKLPRLTLTWPTVAVTNTDAAAIGVLFDLLVDGRDSPMTRTLVDELKLTDEVSGGQDEGEIASTGQIDVRAFDGVALDRVRAGIDAGFKRFDKDGIDPAALARVKTAQEAAFYAALQTVEGKAEAIARAEAASGQIDFVDRRIAQLRAVTADDVLRVYRRYISAQPHIALSIVPKGQARLALAKATPQLIAEEKIVQGAEQAVDQTAGGEPAYARTPSKIDRTIEPPFGPEPKVRAPAIWHAILANGLAASGVVDTELPVAQFALSLDGGQLRDDPARPGAANLFAQLMTRGTAKRTPAELENALKTLGAKVAANAKAERIIVSGTTLARNFAPTMALIREMLLEPRWDQAELALVKDAVVAEIADNSAEPRALAHRVMDKVTYGPDHILSRDILGTEASVTALTMRDLQDYAAKLAPANARFRVAGAVDQAIVSAALAPLATGWTARPTPVPAYPAPAPPTRPALYFYDIPDAKQSALLFGAPSLRRADPDYFPAMAANFILGGGGFASRLTQEVREGKGYTYGVRSAFAGYGQGGMFQIYSPVRANVTLEAAALINKIVADYPATFTAADLTVTRNYLIKSRAIQFEALSDKLDMLAVIGDYGLPDDYPAREGKMLDEMTRDSVRAIAAKYIQPGHMTYVVVGDAKTQMARLDALGLGKPIAANALLATAAGAK